jgi:hypothetical protein
MFVWRISTTRPGVWSWLLLLVSCFFAFYAANYRVLQISETPDALELRFGLFRWSVPWGAVEGWAQDDVSLWRIGGAGIHFTPVRGRYRIYLNFLEHSRVVLNVSGPRRIVRAVAFSTRRPSDVLALVEARVRDHAIAGRGTG